MRMRIFIFVIVISVLFNSCASRVQRESATEPSPKVKLLNDIGGKFYDEGKFLDAKSYFSLAMKLEPTYVDAIVNRAAAFNALGQYQEALQDATRAIKIQPNNVQAYNNRANAYAGLGQYSKALDDYKDSYRLAPGFLDVVFNIANLYYRLNLRLDAVRYYTRAIEIHPGLTQAYIFRGVALYELGYHKRGQEDFERVMSMRARPSHISILLAQALIQTKQFSDAQKVMDILLNDEPDNAEAYYSRAEALYYMKDYSAAYDDIQKALDLKNSVNYQTLLMKIQKYVSR